MSKLFDSIEATILNRVAIREKQPWWPNLTVSDNIVEDDTYPFREGLQYSFECAWHYRAVCENSQGVQDNKIRALQHLKHALYEDIYPLIDNLEQALYNYNIDQAKIILSKIHQEIE
jgi:hypothetical protein